VRPGGAVICEDACWEIEVLVNGSLEGVVAISGSRSNEVMLNIATSS
jgi:hypothetical protein